MIIDNLSLQDVEFLLEHCFAEFTEEQIEVLTENRVEFIKNANKDKIATQHDPDSASMSSDEIVDHIAKKIDPTTRKEHTQWLVNKYKSGDFKLSEGKDIKKALSQFEDAKPHLQSKDLNSIKSVSELKDHIAVTRTAVAKAQKEEVEGKPKDMEKVFEEGDSVGYRIPNKAASVANYGPSGKLAKTRWCTAAEGSNNMFNGYAGGKYTLHLPGSRVIQLHHQSGQMMDENDKPVSLKDPTYKPHANTIRKFIQATHELEGTHVESTLAQKHTPLDESRVNSLIDQAHAHAQKLANNDSKWLSYHDKQKHQEILSKIGESVANGSLSDETFNRLKTVSDVYDDDHGQPKIRTTDLTAEHAKSEEAKPEHLEQIARTKIANDDLFGSDLLHVAKNPNTPSHIHSEMIGAAIKNNNSELAKYVATYGHNLTPDHWSRLENHFQSASTYGSLNDNSHVPEQYLKSALTNSSNGVSSVAAHKSITPNLAKDILNMGVNAPIQIFKNPSVPHSMIEDHIHSAHSGDAISAIMDRDDATPATVSKAVDRGIETGVYGEWLKHPKLSRADTQKILNSEVGKKHIDTVLKGNKAKSEDVDNFLKGVDKIEIGHYRVLHTNVMKAKNISTLLDKDSSSQTINNVLTSGPDFESPHEHMNHEHITKMLASGNMRVDHKHTILQHHAVQLSHFNQLKDDVRMHGAISNSRQAPPSILHELATSPFNHVRLNVAKNPNTEARTHEILATDHNAEIADAAKKRLKK